MKPAGILKGEPRGFTLLEVIIALIVGSILGAILLEFLGQTVHKSFVPIKMAQGSMELTAIVEKMNADYKKQLMLSNDPLVELKSDIDNNTGNYGDFSAATSWIKFSGGTEIADDGVGSDAHRVLKVTVVHGQHELTSLYTR
ncbi:MAG: type II secretion system protein [Deltaproteobacteria bacterium]|jgi:prepilin-type N-terminal cleavage/methylation domain-containing protein|nr:type II secretion system protein [Deltaproteobacteria bacterium]